MEDGKPSKSYTNKSAKHGCCGFALKLICHEKEKLSIPILSYNGSDTIEKFFETFIQLKEYIDECFLIKLQ